MALLVILLVPLVSFAADNDTRQRIDRHLALGKTLLEHGDPAAAQEEFRAVLRLDATQRDALRLMTKAQLQLEARRTDAAKRQASLQQQARDLAETFAKEKAQAQTMQGKRAARQLALAREQQVKLLYNRGMRLYSEGAYPDAIKAFEQMIPLDPAHPLVRSAQEQITRAEIKLSELRAKAGASEAGGPAAVPELERQLAAKRIEMETVMKHARLAVKGRDHDLAIQLLERVLAADPSYRPAQDVLAQEQLAKTADERKHLERLVKQDEAQMMNDVVRAQRVPPAPAAVPASLTASPTLSAQQRLSQPISFSFEGVPLSDVLSFIGDAASLSIIPSPQLDLKTRTVTLKVQDMPLELAVKYLAKTQGLAYRIEPDAVLIASADEFEHAPMETRIFVLRSGLGPLALEASAVTPNPALTMGTLKELITTSVPQPPDSKLAIDERSGSLVATNTPENLKLLEDLLRQLDVAPLQVLIEARFIELTATDLEQLGLESVLTGDADLSKQTDAKSNTQGPGQVIAKGGGIKFPALSREGEGLNMTLQGVLTGTQFETVLHALEESKKSKTLSAPRVAALNNQTAMIRVVDEFRYPTHYEVSLIQFDINGDGDFDDAGETEFANVPKDFQKRDIGILLAVTPSVGQDQKTITLILSPEVSSFSQFRSLEGGVVVPEFSTSQLTTSISIENGQTVVLGGLMKDASADTVSKVPFFGDLPLIGGAFRQTQTSSTRKNLLIFITARILAPRTENT